MATESVATEMPGPRAPISAWDLGEVEQLLKQIRGIAIMGSSTDDFPCTDDMRWVMCAISKMAHEALEKIEQPDVSALNSAAVTKEVS